MMNIEINMNNANNPLKRKNIQFELNKNKKINLSNPLKRKANDFEEKINKRINLNNPLKRKANDFEENKKVKQTKKFFKGIYISADNEVKENAKGSEDNYKEILGGNCDTYSIGNCYQIIYNIDSKEDNNKFLLFNEYRKTIKGPIIIYNTKQVKPILKDIIEALK